MKLRSRFRPKLKIILASLLIGSVINVLVAWGFALTRKSKIFTTHSQHVYQKATWPFGAPATKPEACFHISKRELRGITVIGFTAEDRKNSISPLDRFALSSRYGFPARSMEYSAFTGLSGTNSLHRWGEMDVSAILNKLGLGKRLHSKLPIQPRPLGFAINTLVYALPVYGIWIGATTLRKRRRRFGSVCTQCGYDVSGVNQCPECGEVVRKDAIPTAPAPTGSPAPASSPAPSPGPPSR